MRYIVKQQIWSFGDDFWILDQNQDRALLVDGKVFSWGDTLAVLDPGGSEVARIEQKLLSFKPRYEIIRDGRPFAQVVKEWTWFKKRFTLDVPGPNDYTIDGSFWDHEYTFSRGGRTVAHISKRFWSWSDTYGVDIAEGEDDIAILATCVVIDLVLHDEDDD